MGNKVCSLEKEDMFEGSHVPEKFQRKEQSYVINVNNCRVSNGNPKDQLDLEDYNALLYKSQKDLPILPIPDLNDTC